MDGRGDYLCGIEGAGTVTSIDALAQSKRAGSLSLPQNGDELRLVAWRTPTVAVSFRACGPVGVASTYNANDF